MPITHTNRKGQTYYLHQATTKTGKPNYFFALYDEGDLAGTIPPGYEVYENPNGQVFLRKIRPQLVTPEEVATVEAGVQQDTRLEHYIVDLKKDTIFIYTPDPDVYTSSQFFKMYPRASAEQFAASLQRHRTYSAVLKFVLVNKKERLFQTYRCCFRHSVDDWIPLGGHAKLPNLVSTYVRHLGEDSFHNLYY